MKRAAPCGNKSLWAVWTSLLVSLAGGSFAAEAIKPPPPSEDPADRKVCEGNLNQIFEALQLYRQQHDGRLPDRLSELTPEVIHDRGILICPVVRKQGGLRSWRKRFRELSPDSHTSYGYEFSPILIDDRLWRGLPRRTWRELKERSMDKLGPVVPVVRCHDHQPWLNLGYDGRIYGSGFYWEKNFAKDDHEFMPGILFGGPAPTGHPTAADFPMRDRRADPRLLDLTHSYNALLTDSWQGYPGNHLAGLPAGLQEFGGVRFDVRGLIQLRGEDLPFEYPKRVEGIIVNQKCSRIHFLHGVGLFYTKSGITIGTYKIHYSDKRIQEIPLVSGNQIADWWIDPKNPADPTGAKVVWTGDNEAAKAYGKSLRLCRATWENPLKDTEVATINFDSSARGYAPFLVAITLE